MKRKVGPLPLWAWVLIAGGTIGIVWYLRSPGASAAPADVVLDSSLPATSGPQADLGGGGSGTIADIPRYNADDVMDELLGIGASIAALPGGGQGITDPDPPTQTWAGQIDSVRETFESLNALAALFTPKTTAAKTTSGGKAAKKKKPPQGELEVVGKRTPAQMRADNPAMVERVKKRMLAEKKKHPGSGGAANNGKAKASTAIRRTTVAQTVAPARKREAPHQPAKVTVKSGGGNNQKSRTKRRS